MDVYYSGGGGGGGICFPCLLRGSIDRTRAEKSDMVACPVFFFFLSPVALWSIPLQPTQRCMSPCLVSHSPFRPERSSLRPTTLLRQTTSRQRQRHRQRRRRRLPKPQPQTAKPRQTPPLNKVRKQGIGQHPCFPPPLMIIHASLCCGARSAKPQTMPVSSRTCCRR